MLESVKNFATMTGHNAVRHFAKETINKENVESLDCLNMRIVICTHRKNCGT